QETPIRDPQPSRSITQAASYSQLHVLTLAARDSASDGLWIGAFHPRQIRLLTGNRSHEADAAARCPEELRLQIAAFQKNRADALHFIDRAVNVARLQINSATAIQNDVGIQSKLASVQSAVFYAVIQRQTHKVNVLDSMLLQVMCKPGVAPMSVVEKRAVTINTWVDSFVKNVSDSARVECSCKLSAARVLNAMHRPQDLLDAVEHDAGTWLF